jgi:DNA repair exonuclease SbcCD ATPase subunit
MPFSLEKYIQELRAIEVVYQKQFGTTTILTTPQFVIMRKFFDSIASQVKQSFLQANRDVEAWLKVVMAPLEAQIWEHKAQLKRRKQSIERIHAATETLEDKVQSLEKVQAEYEEQQRTLRQLEAELKNLIASELASLKAAA